MTRASAWLVMFSIVAPWPLATRASAQALQTSALTAAQRQHHAAVQAFARGDYREAIALFSAADKQLPNAAYSFNIAKAYEALGDAPHALGFYRDYLRRAGNPPDTTQVNQRIQALAAQLATQGAGYVTLSSSPSGTPASVERAPVEPSPLASAAPLTAVSGAAPRSPPTPEPAPGSELRTWGFVTLAAGVAALGGGMIFEIMRANTESAAKRESEQTRFAEQLDTLRSQQTVARVFTVTGVALVAAGGVLVTAGILGSNHDSGERLAFGCLPSACHASFAGVF
jgi:tetratricopeptide (TPR) repeat protein